MLKGDLLLLVFSIDFVSTSPPFYLFQMFDVSSSF